MKEALKDRIKRWKGVLSQGRGAPLDLAKEIHGVIEDWPAYRKEAGETNCTTWLISIFGSHTGAKWWESRYQSVAYLGEDIRRNLDHRVAVYAMNHVTPEQIKQVKSALIAAKKKNSDVPVTYGVGVRIIREVTGRKARIKTDWLARCLLLERILDKHAIDYPGKHDDAVAAE